MKLHYHADTDSLYIDLTDAASSESVEIADGIVLDLDADGQPVGIDIDHASKRLHLERLTVTGFPGELERAS